MSSVAVWTVQSPYQAVAKWWVDCSRLVVQRQRNFCRPIEYRSSGRCRRWRWQNEDDSVQGRWWWAGIRPPGTARFGLAATWIPGRPACTSRLGVTLTTSKVASRPERCGRHRCKKRLQRLQKILINAFVIFVSVYYFNKRHMKCRKKLCRLNSESGTDVFRRIGIYKTVRPNT